MLLAVSHQEPDRLPVFKPNIIPTHEPFDDRVQSFLDTFEFDRLAGVGGVVDGPSTRRELADETSEDAYVCRFQYMGVGSPYCIHHINSTLVLRALDEVGDYTDIVSTGDDFGHSTASYMSPEDFRAHIKPYYQDLIGRIKARFPHIKFYLHSHGRIMDLVPDLIDCGVDILNPILPLDHTDPVRLKREFGSRLAFEGGIDIERVLPFGTLGEVKEHLKRVIDVLAPGGGYLFKAQATSPLIPCENLLTTYELPLEHGRYGS